MADVAGAGAPGGSSNGVAFLVSSTFVFGVVAACCSSPQTAELNADQRAETLMKWAAIGEATSALFVGIAAVSDKKHRTAILAGGALAGGLMWAYYAHAKAAGLASTAPPTETY
jgi:hypothetical protein